jgi:hypothetical protein
MPPEASAGIANRANMIIVHAALAVETSRQR